MSSSQDEIKVTEKMERDGERGDEDTYAHGGWTEKARC